MCCSPPTWGWSGGSQDGRKWRVRQTFILGFDVRLDPNALGRDKVDLARLTRKGGPTVEIASLQLGTERGVTVFGHACIPPSQLSQWHRVEIRIKFSDKDTGYSDAAARLLLRHPITATAPRRSAFEPLPTGGFAVPI